MLSGNGYSRKWGNEKITKNSTRIVANATNVCYNEAVTKQKGFRLSETGEAYEYAGRTAEWDETGRTDL